MNDTLTPVGFIFMVLTWAAIAVLNVFCFSKIFTDKKEEIPDPLPALDADGK
jgi:hypothetical protein